MKNKIIERLIRIIPKRIIKILALNSLSRIHLESGNFKVSFSQQGEDILLQNIFIKKDGFYVDVGAFHPLIYSNTHVFYLKGWHGINIEPNPDVIHEFNKIRTRDININMAVAATEGRMTYFKFNHGAVNTLNEEHARLWEKEPGYSIVEKTEIKVRPLVAILEEFVSESQAIDFMSVDCEGSDLEVLK